MCLSVRVLSNDLSDKNTSGVVRVFTGERGCSQLLL